MANTYNQQYNNNNKNNNKWNTNYGAGTSKAECLIAEIQRSDFMKKIQKIIKDFVKNIVKKCETIKV